MITVQAPSRLHFGLFNLAADTHWPDAEGKPNLPARHFGGVGLMVRDPGVRVTVRPSPDWSATGPFATRALDYARRLADGLQPYFTPVPQHISIEPCGAEHAGLGTGTQLALAVGRALLESFGDLQLEAIELARLLGRGTRSALGIHGFEQGGFLVEGGKGKPTESAAAPLVARSSFPEDWRIVLVIPSGVRGLHGGQERQAFQELQDRLPSSATIDALCRLALLGMLPALAEHDLTAFGEALYNFNRRVGELFAPVQGGTYCQPRTAEMIDYLRQDGIRGVGQSSWGPTVFAVVADDDQAGKLADKICKRFSLQAGEVICTTACNTGATLQLTTDN
jgi:beta-ribofuranosylaminobenzene 5'-phosphate synthase